MLATSTVHGLTWKSQTGTQQPILTSQGPVCFNFTILLNITEVCYERKLCASPRILAPKVINLFANDVIFLEGAEVQLELPRPELIENSNTPRNIFRIGQDCTSPLKK